MRNIYTMPTGQVPAASNPSRLRGIMTAKRILRGQILSICAVALLGTMPAVFAQSPDAQTPDAQSRDAHTPDAEALEAQSLAAQSGNVRSGEITPLHLVAQTLGTNPNAVDAWSVHCPGGTHHIHFDVRDFVNGGPAFGILAQDFETGFSAVRRASSGADLGHGARGAGARDLCPPCLQDGGVHGPGRGLRHHPGLPHCRPRAH